MKATDSFIVDYPQTLKDRIQYGSLNLYNYRKIKEEWNRILHGKVIENPMSNKFRHLQKGDLIYFGYLVPEPHNIIDGGMLKVPARNVHCYVRDGKIHTYGDVVLTEPAYPDDTEEVDVAGKKIRAQVSKKSGLVVKTDIKYSKKLTRVCHVAENEMGIEEGDMVVMTRNSDQRYEIEGKWYFVIPYEEIIAKYTVHPGYKPHEGDKPVILRP